MHCYPDENTPPYGTRSPFLDGRRTPPPFQPLDLLAERLITTLSARPELGIQEGEVRSAGEPSYRRLDCDRRALAYIRCRPKHRCVRIDVSGLWAVPRRTPLLHPRSFGRVVLVLTRPPDVEEAVRYLAEAIQATRAAAEFHGLSR